MGGLVLFSEFQIIIDGSLYSHCSNIFSEVCFSVVFKGHVNYLSCRYCYQKTWPCCANLGVATPFDKGLHQWIFLIDFFWLVLIELFWIYVCMKSKTCVAKYYHDDQHATQETGLLLLLVIFFDVFRTKKCPWNNCIMTQNLCSLLIK